MTGARPSLRVLSFRPLRKGTLAGFVTVELGSELRLRDCCVHTHPSGRCWVSLPAKPIIDTESFQLRRAERDRLADTAICEWRDRATGDRVSEIVIGLLRQHYGLDGGRA
jgi:hypothetical protein